jgi:glycosyltransferase involved in cell wall biosynthesis
MENEMTSPLVSAVIPTCNRADLVKRAVMTALAQTYPHMEVVVVVDGPDEDTVRLLQQMADARLKVVTLSERVGGSEARNEGVRVASGDWIAFLDDDDEWVPDKVEKQLSAAEGLGVDFPVVASRFIARSPRADYLWPTRLLKCDEDVSEYLFVRKSIFFGEALLQTSTLFARKALLEMVPFTRGLKKHQDWDWVLRVAQLQGVRFCMVDEPLAVWYVEENRSNVSGVNLWRFSLQWINENRHLITRRAYTGFIVTQVSPQASRDLDWRAFFPLAASMFSNGALRPLDLLMFCAMWGVPQKLRRTVRALCMGLRSKPGSIDAVASAAVESVNRTKA